MCHQVCVASVPLALNSCPHLPQSASLNVKVILNASKHWNNPANFTNFKAESAPEGPVSTKTFWIKTPEVLETDVLAWHFSSLSPAAAHFRQVCSRRSCWTFFGCHKFTNQQNARGLVQRNQQRAAGYVSFTSYSTPHARLCSEMGSGLRNATRTLKMPLLNDVISVVLQPECREAVVRFVSSSCLLLSAALRSHPSVLSLPLVLSLVPVTPSFLSFSSIRRNKSGT